MSSLSFTPVLVNLDANSNYVFMNRYRLLTNKPNQKLNSKWFKKNFEIKMKEKTENQWTELKLLFLDINLVLSNLNLTLS